MIDFLCSLGVSNSDGYMRMPTDGAAGMMTPLKMSGSNQ